MPTFSRLRAGIVLACLAFVLCAMTGRVAYLETYGRQKTVRSAERQQHTTMGIPARRGSIFDCKGQELVGTVQTLAVYVDPHFMLEQYQKEKYAPRQMDNDLAKLAELIGCDAGELGRMVRAESEKRYVKIAEDMTSRIGEEVLKLGMPGVGIEPVAVRYYPMGSVAAHVLGGVDKDGIGQEGLELRFQKDLTGKDGIKRIEKDARRRWLSIDQGDYVPPVHGQHLVLTIDSNIQMLAEQELEFACTKFKAERGEAIVMDPYTGEVLALANWPSFNPQNRDAPVEARTNATLVMPYEPGSILKPFIVGPALMNHQIRVNEKWPTGGNPYIDPFGRQVRDVHAVAGLCTWDVIVKSSNQGATMIAHRVGKQGVYKSLTSFGFGRRTGIELPGEDSGRLYPVEMWKGVDIASVAQGYYIMVTPIQLARAYCAYANGGYLVQPHIVKGKLGEDGKLIERYPNLKLDDMPRVLDEETVLTMRRIMADVPVRGTAARTRSKYWNVFGKTGTAHISQGRSGYAARLYNSSFLCGAPLENPKIVVAMTIHKPDRSLGWYGGTVTAPAAVRLIERVLAYMQVPQSPPLPLPPADVIPMLYNFNPNLYGEHTQTAAR